MELVDQLTKEFVVDHIARRGDAKSPGAGRAKLRLSRGFPALPRLRRHPYRLVDKLTKEFMGFHAIRQDDAKSPGSDRASPHLRRSFQRREQSFSNWPVMAVSLHGFASSFPNGSLQSRFGLLLGCLRTGHVKDFFFHQRPVQVIDAVVQ
jgi:hypothetical protein